MNLHLWLGFVIASLVMGLIPGPGVMSIVGYAVGSGRGLRSPPWPAWPWEMSRP